MNNYEMKRTKKKKLGNVKTSEKEIVTSRQIEN